MALWDQMVQNFFWLCEKSIGLWKNLKQIDSKIYKMKEKLKEFHQVLRDSEDTNPDMQEWLEEVDDLAYDIEDILDVVLGYETNQSQVVF